MGYLQPKVASNTGRIVDGWLGHEAGCVVRHMYVKQKLLHQLLAEQLERCGYTKNYHKHIKWCEKINREDVQKHLAAE